MDLEQLKSHTHQRYLWYGMDTLTPFNSWICGIGFIYHYQPLKTLSLRTQEIGLAFACPANLKKIGDLEAEKDKQRANKVTGCGV